LFVQRIAIKNEDEAESLLPVVQCVGTARHRGVDRSCHAVDQRTLFVNMPGPHRDKAPVRVNEARQKAREPLWCGYIGTELDAVTCRSLHKQVQDSIQSWL
jgi:hypothetical protein